MMANGVSSGFWSFAVINAAYTHGFTPSRTIEWKAPNKFWSDRPLDVSHLRAFWCKCFVQRGKDDGAKKLGARGIEGRFLGYGEAQKGYRVWLLVERKVVMSRNITFFEYTLPAASVEVETEAQWSGDEPDDAEDSVDGGARITEETEPEGEVGDLEGQGATAEGVEGARQGLEAAAEEQGVIVEEGAGPEGVEHEVVAQGPELPRRSTRNARAPGTHRNNGFEDPDPEPAGPTVPYMRNNTKARAALLFHAATAELDQVDCHQDLEPEFIRALATRTRYTDPLSYDSVMAGPDASLWCDAQQVEMNAMAENRVWELVERVPPGGNLVGNRWVHNPKLDEKGELAHRKARLTAQGFTQKCGLLN